MTKKVRGVSADGGSDCGAVSDGDGVGGCGGCGDGVNDYDGGGGVDGCVGDNGGGGGGGRRRRRRCNILIFTLYRVNESRKNAFYLPHGSFIIKIVFFFLLGLPIAG